jgi:hypothetical protein
MFRETNEPDCVKYLLVQCPGFDQHWRKHREWWGAEPAGLMIDLGLFGEYSAEAIERNDPSELSAIATAADRLVCWPDEHVQAAATVGFLEGLTNRCLAEPDRFPFQRLARLLSADVIAACRDLDDSWGTQTPGVS